MVKYVSNNTGLLIHKLSLFYRRVCVETSSNNRECVCLFSAFTSTQFMKKGCTRLAAASNKVYQLLAQGRWFSPGISTTKTGRHDRAEILLKVTLKHQKINQSISQSIYEIIFSQ